MLSIHIHTLFPEYFGSALNASILGRARARGLVEVYTHDIRAHADDKHRTADDVPFGGGGGMVMKVAPVVSSLEAVLAAKGEMPVWLLSPAGRMFNQDLASEWASLPRLGLVCGHYEGVDARVERYIQGEVSIGDYVLTGGEPAALVIVDALCRLIPGALGNAASAHTESHTGEPLLEHPHYTRPREFRGVEVPDVLLSGDHGAVARWRRRQSLIRTRERRPDLWQRALPHLGAKDLALVESEESSSPPPQALPNLAGEREGT